MTQHNDTPRIRFKGFKGKWERKPFSSVFMMLQNNTLSRAELSEDKGTIYDIHYGDILIKYPEYIIIGKMAVPFVNANRSEEMVKKYGASMLRNGDIIIADTAEDETTGKCSEIVDANNKLILSGLHTIPCRPHECFAPYYLGFYMNSESYHNQLLPLMQGIKVISVAKSSLQDTIISFPILAEQRAIGAYFAHLDELIEAESQKLDKLKNMKKSCLEKMFPKPGCDVPEVRFKGFTGKWERKKLGEVTRVLSGSRVHKDEWRTEGVPFFRSSDVVATYKKIDNDKAFISFELYEELCKSSGKLEKNDILITGGGSIGIPYLVPSNEPLYSKDADLLWIKHSQHFNSIYLYYFFIGDGFKRYLSEISHIGTIAHYTIEQVKDTPAYFPTLAEQRAIGAYFTNLDELIEAQGQKVEKLRRVKKACLDGMFV